MRESKYKDYTDLPLTLTAPEVGGGAGDLPGGSLRAGSFGRVSSHDDRQPDPDPQGQVHPVDR